MFNIEWTFTFLQFFFFLESGGLLLDMELYNVGIWWKHGSMRSETCE